MHHRRILIIITFPINLHRISIIRIICMELHCFFVFALGCMQARPLPDSLSLIFSNHNLMGLDGAILLIIICWVHEWCHHRVLIEFRVARGEAPILALLKVTLIREHFRLYQVPILLLSSFVTYGL